MAIDVPVVEVANVEDTAKKLAPQLGQAAERKFLTQFAESLYANVGLGPQYVKRVKNNDIWFLRSVTDLLSDNSYFSYLFSIFKDFNLTKYPVWRFKSGSPKVIPVDITNPFIMNGLQERDFEPNKIRLYSNKWSKLNTKGSKIGPQMMNLKDVEKTYRTSVGRSLIHNLQQKNLKPKNYRVHAQNSGYRIHWTYVHQMKPSVFGAPSSPVDGFLSNNHYRFGGDIGGVIIWDHGVHIVSNKSRSTTVTAF